MIFLVLIQIYLFISQSVSEKKYPEVKTQSGTVIGYYKQSYDGRLFSAFEGVPYAKPPIGSLRFEEPQPNDPWLGNWIANKVHTCIQVDLKGIVGFEDCLYINVYSPRLQPTCHDNLDVIVHIHGGSFIIANPEAAGPKFLMDREVLYVNFNYRLGSMGFLSTDDDSIKGNMGLKDQVLALQWIQSNIKEFGGNPLSVTLTGASSGAAAAHLHYFSQKSKGLFHRGMSQSGTATVPFAFQKAALNNAKKLASAVGCSMNSTKVIVNCLRQRPASELIIKEQSITKRPGFPFISVGPVIEKHSKSAFLTEHPYRLLAKGYVNDIPWITSITTEEGISAATDFSKEFDYIDKNWENVAPLLLNYENNFLESQQKHSISKAIRQYYFNNETISMMSIRQFIKLITDRYFALDFEKCARIQTRVNHSPVYTYIYSYQQESLDSRDITGFNESYGVDHGTDGFLLYDVQYLGFNFYTKNLTKSDEVIKNFFVDMLVTFAKTGNPSVKNIVWNPVKNMKELGYLFVKNPKNIAMYYKNEIAPTEFWQSLNLKDY